jgi:hypothetical protein
MLRLRPTFRQKIISGLPGVPCSRPAASWVALVYPNFMLTPVSDGIGLLLFDDLASIADPVVA